MCPDLFTFTTDSRAIAVVIQLDNSHQNFAAFFSLMERDRIYIHMCLLPAETYAMTIILHGELFSNIFSITTLYRFSPPINFPLFTMVNPNTNSKIDT